MVLLPASQDCDGPRDVVLATLPLPCCTLRCDGAALHLQCNPLLESLLDAKCPQDLLDALGPDAASELVLACERAARLGYASAELQLDRLLASNDPRLNQRAYVAPTGVTNTFVAVMVDVGAEFGLESLLSEHAASCKALLDILPQGIVIADLNNTVLYANQAAEALTGAGSNSMVGAALSFGINASGVQEIDLSPLVGQRMYGRVQSAPLRWLGLDARVITIADVTRFHDAQNQVRQAALQDALTGLANRVALVRHANLHMPDQAGQALGLLLVNVRRFAQFNARFGADLGDALLKDIAVALKQTVPDGPAVLLARLGGDTFAILEPGPADVEHAQQRAVQLLARVHRVLEARQEYRAVSLYAVLALAPLHASSALELLDFANLTAQAARAEHRARGVIVADVQARQRFDVRASLDSQLNEAMVRGQFSVVYQPLIRISDWSFMGFEALVRWNHPGRGLLTPASFIQEMGQMGLLNALGLDVLRMVCEQLSAWRAQGMPRCRVSVNLAPAQLMVPELADSLMYLAEAHDVAPGDITFELTETGILEDFDQALCTLSALKSAGFSLALDDFGTGYSSLSHLRNLPVDYVKIDRSFVAKLPHSASDFALVQAVVVMSHALGMQVVSEGVETAAQVNAVQAAGVDILQGYFWGRPLHPEDAQRQWLCDGSLRIAQLRMALSVPTEAGSIGNPAL